MIHYIYKFFSLKNVRYITSRQHLPDRPFPRISHFSLKKAISQSADKAPPFKRMPLPTSINIKAGQKQFLSTVHTSLHCRWLTQFYWSIKKRSSCKRQVRHGSRGKTIYLHRLNYGRWWSCDLNKICRDLSVRRGRGASFW